MKKLKIIRELLGEDVSDFIALDLKKSYKLLKRDLENESSVPVFSYDREEEVKEVTKLLEAFKIVHSYYSVDEIK